MLELNHDNAKAKKAFKEIFKDYSIFAFGNSTVYPIKIPDLGSNPLRKVKQKRFRSDSEKTSPDYALIIDNEIRLVNILYRRIFSYKELYYYAFRTIKKIDPVWIFLLSCDRIFFDQGAKIVEKKGYARQIDQGLLNQEIKKRYFDL